MSNEACQNYGLCNVIKKYLSGEKGPNTIEDILKAIELLSAQEDARSGALSCRLVFGIACMLHPDNKKITDARIQRALKNL